MRRTLLLPALLCGLCLTSAQAQIPKPKIRLPAVGGNQQTQAKPKCDNSIVVVDEPLIGRYIKGLRARDSALRVLARGKSPTAAYYASVVAQQDGVRRRIDFDNQVGTDWTRYKALEAKIMTGDTAAARQQAAIRDEIYRSQAEPQAPDWETQKAANDSLDVVMKRAGGFSDCDWLAINDPLPMLIWAVTNNPDVKPSEVAAGQRGQPYTAAEVAVVRAHREELARLMGYRYKSAEQLKREKEPPPQAAAAAAPAPAGPGGAEYQQCLAKEMIPVEEYSKAHADELEAARESGDMAKMMPLINLQNQAMQKCAPLFKQ